MQHMKLSTRLFPPALLPSFLFLAALLLAAPAASQDAAFVEVPAWGDHFRAAGVTGTFVLRNSRQGRTLVFNPARARERFLPASTFKILHSLIALDTEAARSIGEQMAWDGTDRGVEGWNQDLTMGQAFAASAVWYYQELARRIGRERMAEAVARARYGNADIGGAIDSFWLEGRLKISALEQIDVLRRLEADVLPFRRRTQEAVRELMVVERTGAHTLRAKTGWAARTSPQVGWWVGWVERGADRFFFALNMDLSGPGDAPARLTVARAILKEQGALP